MQLACLDLLQGFVKPVAHQIGATRNGWAEQFTQGIEVGAAQFAALFAAAQKRRVAHHHIGLGPRRFCRAAVCPFARPRQQRVAAFDLLQRLQHGGGFGRVAVGHAPLDFANPDADAGQFGGVFVDLDAQQVVRAGDQVLLAVQSQAGGLGDGEQFHVLEGFEAQEQEVAAAAGGVEDAERPQRFQPLDEAAVCLFVGGVAMPLDFGRERLQFLRRLFPLLEQRPGDDGIDDAGDGGRVGVVRAQLAALGGVEAALEQGAEDGNVDGAPVHLRRVAQFGNGGGFQRGHVNVLEQAAVEPGDVVGTKRPACAHGLEQVPEAIRELFAAAVAVVDEPLEHAPGQQGHVFGKETEQALGEKVRHLVGTVAACAQLFGQRGKAAGGGFGDGAGGLVRAKAFGVEPDAAQELLLGRVGQVWQADEVGFARVAVELGVDADDEAVAHDQQRRVAQRQAVLLQLAQRGVQVLAGSLVFPGEAVAVKHIGVAAGFTQHQGVLLEQVIARTARRGHAQQRAQVHEIGLRARALAQGGGRAARAPLGNEFGGSHVRA